MIQIIHLKAVIWMVVNGKVSVVGKRVSGSICNSSTVIGNVEKAENIYVKEIDFNNRYEFPSIGKPNMVYVAQEISLGSWTFQFSSLFFRQIYTSQYNQEFTLRFLNSPDF